MSYWQVPEDTIYSLLGVEATGYAPEAIDQLMPEDLPKTAKTREVYYNTLTEEGNFGKVESAVEQVLDDVRHSAKELIDDYITYRGRNVEEAEHLLWYKNMADDFAQETLFDLRGGVPEYNEINLTYMPEMFEWLEIEEDPRFLSVALDQLNEVGNETWEGWVVPTLKEVRDAAVEEVRTSPIAWTEDQWKEAMDKGIVVVLDDIDDSFNIYYQGHLIEQGIRDANEANEFATEIARHQGRDPEKEVFYYNTVADDTASDYDENYSKHMPWTPRPKADPRQEKLPFAAAASSYRGTPRYAAPPEAPAGYTLEMYYDIVTTESAEEGDVAERGYVVDNQRYPIEDPTQGIPEEDKEYHEVKYGTLEEVVDDLSHYSWIEWSSSPSSPGDWLVSESTVEDYTTDENISYSAFVNHLDGSNLTPEEMQYVHDRLNLYGKVRTAEIQKVGAPTQSPEKLATKIQELLNASQAEWDDVMEGSDPIYTDTKILVGDNQVENILGGEINAPAALTYDGAGYDLLSYEGEMEHMGGSDIRRDIINAAAEMGYMTEDVNNWSMAFYPDESAEPLPRTKRETPQWLREQLEEEFGAEFKGGSTRRQAIDYTQVEDYERDVLGLEEEAKKHMRFLMQSAPGMPLDVASNPNYLVEYVAEAMQHPEWLEANHATHPIWDWADEVILEMLGPLSEEW